MGKVGIIGAMDVEVDQLKGSLCDAKVSRRAHMDFVSGTLNGRDVVVVKSGVGKVNAGICAQILCELGCEAILFTGVAGSLDPKVAVLDLVISTECVYFDVDARNFGYVFGEIPQMGIASFPADPILREMAVKAARELGKGHSIFTGKVASGDRFVCSSEDKAKIHELTGALCCEMEGAAVAQACYLNAVPYVVVRAISDMADGSSPLAYPLFEKRAAKLCAQIIHYMLMRL